MKLGTKSVLDALHPAGRSPAKPYRLIADRGSHWIPVQGHQYATLAEAHINLAKLSVEDADGGPFSVALVEVGRSPAEVPPKWKADKEVSKAAAQVQTAIMECKTGRMHYPTDALDALCNAVWRSAQPHD